MLGDVFANPGTSIRAIAERTALPESYVSESVAKLREEGLVSTEVEAADRRRTLVRVRSEHALGVARKGAGRSTGRFPKPWTGPTPSWCARRWRRCHWLPVA